MLADSKITISRCRSCGHVSAETPDLCPVCLSGEFILEAGPTEGMLYSFTRVSSGDKEARYAIGYVDTSVGLRMLTLLVPADLAWKCDQPVAVEVVAGDLHASAMAAA